MTDSGHQGDFQVSINGTNLVTPGIPLLDHRLILVHFIPTTAADGNILVRDVLDTTTYVSVPILAGLVTTLLIGLPIDVDPRQPAGFAFKADDAGISGLLVCNYQPG